MAIKNRNAQNNLKLFNSVALGTYITYSFFFPFSHKYNDPSTSLPTRPAHPLNKSKCRVCDGIVFCLTVCKHVVYGGMEDC